MKAWAISAACVLLSLGFAGPASATVDPTPPSTAQLETRANAAFNRGEYYSALPALKKLSETFKDEPARLGPIQEKIRVCEKALASLKTAPAAKPSLDPVTGAARKPHPAPKAGEIVELSIKDLGNFEYDQTRGGGIPADVVGMSSAKVRLRGYMIPMDQAENITQFALVPSLAICCIGQGPQIQHTIVCDCPKGKSIGYCPDEIIIEGTLKVEEKKDDGYIVSIFSLGVTSVKQAPK